MASNVMSRRTSRSALFPPRATSLLPISMYEKNLFFSSTHKRHDRNRPNAGQNARTYGNIHSTQISLRSESFFGCSRKAYFFQRRPKATTAADHFTHKLGQNRPSRLLSPRLVSKRKIAQVPNDVDGLRTAKIY